ncbi:MAG: UvrD-helicase domain-containing protein [Alphaproteobacteria bacterium]
MTDVSAPWLADLNPEQRQAVEATEGAVLVLSGAGTGKTRVLTTRLAHILALRRAEPWQILAVTFTNRAAREMRERLAAMIGPVAESVWLGTFHALGARMLRRHAELVGLKSNFTILDTDDQLRLLKQILEAAHIDTKKFPPQGVMGRIQRWKDRGLPPTRADDDGGDGDGDGGKGGDWGRTVYAQYQERLRDLNAADFGDLLLHCLTVFQDHPDVAADYQKRFHYILVDEYQDTNVSQYLWLRLLARGHGNLCCVGDDDQSIYSWRGAEVGNILRFEKDFPGARVVRLESNYRSSAHILRAASGLIRHNAERLGKELRTAAAGGDLGEKVMLRGVWDGAEEARVVIEEIEAGQGHGGSLAGMAILVRAGFQTREFEERLIVTGLPYRVIGGPRFYERQEIRDALAYFRVIAQPDDDLAFERIVNVPKRGLGESALQSLHILKRAAGVSLMEAGRRLIATDELAAKARGSLTRLVEHFDRWRGLMDGTPHARLAETVLDESGYTAMWRADRSPDAPGRLENLKELVRAMADHETLVGFLEHVSLVMENDQAADRDRVTLMTLHAAKGLEFDQVFLPGWEEGLFPHQRSLAGGAKALEEERRLAYVGITRARRRVFISFAAHRKVYNQWQNALPSRFIDELPPDHVERHSDAGVYAGARGMAEPPVRWGAGWKRREWTPSPPPAARSAPVASDSGDFAVGDRVVHRKFGSGTVEAVDGDKLSIRFDRGGTRRVVETFVDKDSNGT